MTLPRRLHALLKSTAAGVAAAALVVLGVVSAGSARSAVPRRLLSLASDATAATGVRYSVHDDRGNSMDTLKVVQSGPGRYVGVYHTETARGLVVKVATSTNVLDWHYAGDLDRDSSQPTIRQLRSRAYLVVYEKQSVDATRHWLRFRHYDTRADLLRGAYRWQRDTAPSLSKIEGTPSITAVKLAQGLFRSTITVGLHYNTPAGDREAIGMLTNFRDWSEKPNRRLNTRLAALRLHGNFGDRDVDTVLGTKLELVEGQANPQDWGSWRVYAHDPSTGDLRSIRLRTRGGSVSFGNPTLTAITAPNGHRALVVTYFLFSGRAAAGEAGELIFYTTIS